MRGQNPLPPSQVKSATVGTPPLSCRRRCHATMTVRRVYVEHPSRPNPVNSLGWETRLHVRERLRSAMDDPEVTSIVLIGRGRNFSAGADIGEFARPASVVSGGKEDAPSLAELCDLIESSPKPVVAAVRGVALGGGLELALACRLLVADPGCTVGLPETKIGLIPGAGGTQRLPRLCGVEFALDVICSGRNVGAEEALGAGLMDGILGRDGGRADETLEECAARWAAYAEVAVPICLDYGRTSLRSVPGGPSDLGGICDAFAEKLPPKERGGEAANAAVEAVRASFQRPSFREGMAVEEELFMDLLVNSSQGRALRHAFFAERAAGRSRSPPKKGAGGSPEAAGDEPSEAAELLLKSPGGASVGVIGAGTMGSGIALSFLRGGYRPVVLVDNNAGGLERGVKSIQKIIAGDLKRGRISPRAAEKLGAGLRATSDMKDLARCALIVEAAFEDLGVKRAIFAELDAVARPDALLLSNTSSLDVDLIASALASPRRRSLSAGMHFFSPAHVMRLVEIVRSSSASESTLDVIRGVTGRLGKVGVVVGNSDGFVGNRMLSPYTSEMAFLVLEGGASVEGVDAALTEFGMSMGPFAMSDMAGNDIAYNIRKEGGLVDDPETGAPGRNRRAGMRYTTLADELVTKLGRIGQKAGRGWYDYDPKVGGGRRPIPSKEVADFIASHPHSAPRDAESRLAPREIVQRLLYPLVNEGFKVLEEGVASHPDDVDIIYLFGYGFPRWRGGPMHWADNEVGLPNLLEALEEFRGRHPGSEYYRPSDLLRECVHRGVKVREYYERGWHADKGRDDAPRSKL